MKSVTVQPPLMIGLVSTFISQFAPLLVKPITMQNHRHISPENLTPKGKFADIIKSNGNIDNVLKSKIYFGPIPLNKETFIDGIPTFQWTGQEVYRMNIIENLQYLVVSKLSYGWPEISKLRELIPK